MNPASVQDGWGQDRRTTRVCVCLSFLSQRETRGIRKWRIMKGRGHGARQSMTAENPRKSEWKETEREKVRQASEVLKGKLAKEEKERKRKRERDRKLKRGWKNTMLWEQRRSTQSWFGFGCVFHSMTHYTGPQNSFLLFGLVFLTGCRSTWFSHHIWWRTHEWMNTSMTCMGSWKQPQNTSSVIS